MAKQEKKGKDTKSLKSKLQKLSGKSKKAEEVEEEPAAEEEEEETCFGKSYSPAAKECKRCGERKKCAAACGEAEEAPAEEKPVKKKEEKKPAAKAPAKQAKVAPKAKAPAKEEKPAPKAKTPAKKKPSGPKKKTAAELDRDVVREALAKGGTLKQIAEASYKLAKKTWERRVEIQLWSFGLGFGLDKDTEELQKSKKGPVDFYTIGKVKKKK